tara:strand:+ start:10914 stop:11291 length:378 start_codon:yes stop_codon:yes gene_type:complete
MNKALAVLTFFGKLGDLDYNITQDEIDAVFDKDFVMIAFGKTICSYSNLIAHFHHIQEQIGQSKIVIHEHIETDEKVAVRYDIHSEKKGIGHVIAIFKYKPNSGLVYEMNEVFGSADSAHIDMSK